MTHLACKYGITLILGVFSGYFLRLCYQVLATFREEKRRPIMPKGWHREGWILFAKSLASALLIFGFSLWIWFRIP